jgi:hypothetical protein
MGGLIVDNPGGEPILFDPTVRVASCWDVPHADVVRMVLAMEGIPASLGNATFLSWFWQYGNAVGGATIDVHQRDAEHAREALAAARATTTEVRPYWTCSTCGQRVAGQWDVCWQCGHAADGAEGDVFVAEAVALPAGGADLAPWWHLPRFVAVVATGALLYVLLRHGPMVPLMLAPLVIFFVFLLWRFEAKPGTESKPGLAIEPEDQLASRFQATRSAANRATVQRAWQMAVLAILYFPPLGFCSMRLLWKLSQRNTPLGQADQWRCGAALICSVIAIIQCLVFAVMLAFGMFLA